MQMINGKTTHYILAASACALGLWILSDILPNVQASMPEGVYLKTSQTTSMQDFQGSTRALKAGDTQTALQLLTQASDKGLLVAQWQLAQVYMNGEIVQQDEEKAASIYKSIILKHSEIVPKSANAKFVSNSYVALSKYYRTGLKSYIVKNQLKAKELLTYAATYFGDADAQYLLGTMFLNGEGGAQDGTKAMQWFKLAARKNQILAQCMIGKMLFYGEAGVKMERVQGLVRLQVAQDSLSQTRFTKNIHVENVCVYNAAFQAANEQERVDAARLFERVKGQ